MSQFTCAGCGEEFLESDAQRKTESEPTEAWGVKQDVKRTILACPVCGSTDLTEEWL